MLDVVWVEIEKSAIRHNVETIRRRIGKDVLLAPMVKSNAYGHDLSQMAPLLASYGVDWLSVNSLWEAKIIRESGVSLPILVVVYFQNEDLKEATLIDGVRIMIHNRQTAQQLSYYANGKTIPVHLKVDTGLTRHGILCSEFFDFYKTVSSFGNLEIEGLATHFANADEAENQAYFHYQLDLFTKLQEQLKNKGIHIPIVHCGNSPATLLYPQAHYNLVRPGKSVYGYYPSPSVRDFCRQNGLLLRPALTWKTKVAQVKTVAPKTLISYGCTYETKRKTTIAVLPVGYYDGFDRRLSNCGDVLIRGNRARVLGRVCMNVTVVDVTEIAGVAVEDEVVLIGKQGNQQITVEDMAGWIGTINYEIIARLRESMPRFYI